MYEIKLVKDAIDKLKPSSVDNIVDKAHYFTTCWLLLFFVLLIGTKQIFGDPISCTVPAEFPDAWVSYVHSYCYVTSTHVLRAKNGSGLVMPQEGGLPPDVEKIDITYYQWIPFLLAIQAAFFYGPHLLWSLIQKSHTDVNFKYLVDKCQKSRHETVENRKEAVSSVVAELNKVYEHRKIKDNASGLGYCGLATYMVSKALNIVNVFLQIYVLNAFLGNTASIAGFHVIANAFKNIGWIRSGFFPLVTFCHFKRNVLGTLEPHTFQCVLMMNMISEKIFLFLYIWFTMLLVITVVDAFYTAVCYASRLGHRRASRRYLMTHANKDHVDWSRFANYQLGRDGLLLLHLIENNAGFPIASEVACKFYDSIRTKAICATVDSHANDDKKNGGVDNTRRCIVDGSLAKEIDADFANISETSSLKS